MDENKVLARMGGKSEKLPVVKVTLELEDGTAMVLVPLTTRRITAVTGGLVVDVINIHVEKWLWKP